MRDKKVIEEMVVLAERFGQKVEFDEFDGRGGWCRVKGTDRVIINQRLTPKEQIRILAQVLAGYPIEEQAMLPKVRQIIEEVRFELGMVLKAGSSAASESEPEEHISATLNSPEIRSDADAGQDLIAAIASERNSSVAISMLDREQRDKEQGVGNASDR